MSIPTPQCSRLSSIAREATKVASSMHSSILPQTMLQLLAKVWCCPRKMVLRIIHAAQPYPDDESLAARLRADQLRKTARLGASTLPAQLVCALALVVLLYEKNPSFSVTWIAVLLGISLVAILRIRSNLKLREASKRNLAIGTMVILGAACAWGSLPIVVLGSASTAEKFPIVLSMVGIASAGAVVFQTIPIAAAGWVLIVGTCTIAGMKMDGFVHLWGIAGGAILLIGVLLRNIWMTSEQFFACHLLVDEANRLAQSLSEHALIVESTSNGIVVLDEALKVKWINQGFQRQSGYCPQDAIGRSPSEWLGTEVSASTLAALQRNLDAERKAQAELRYRHRDGSWVWVQLDVRRICQPTNGSSAYVLIATDITDLKHTAQELKEEQERQGHIIDGTHCGTWEVDFDGGSCKLGGHWLDIIGIDTAAPLLASGEFLLGRIHPDEQEGHRSAIRRYVQGLTPHYAHEHRLRHEDGSWRWVSARGKASKYGPKGEICQMSGISMDISKSKATELALIDATRQAKQANHAKSLFLATMSHEIRTPMNGVIGTAEWLKVTQLDEEQRDGIQTIVESGRALLTIIDDILDFTKIEAGRMKLEEAAVSLVDLAEGVADAIRPVAINKHVDMHVFVDPRLPDQIMGDATRLRQVLFNLTGNAVKFSVGTEDRHGQVDVHILMSDEGTSTWLMQISDDGIGMAAHTVSKLFKPFMQGEAETTRRFGGTGLGLAICHRLVELMGGGIVVHSVPGHGSTFTVTLPMLIPSETKQRSTAHVDLSGVTCALLRGKNYRSESLAAYLEHAGADVHVCYSNEEAREMAGEQGTMVLISDVPANTSEETSSATTDETWGGHVRHLWISSHGHGPVRWISPHIGQLGRAHAQDVLRAVASLACRLSPELAGHGASQIDEFCAELNSTRHRKSVQNYLILIAEDDSINQKVVKRQLKTLGYACEVADNGAEALKLWRTGDFDLLISDLHMPDLDGYELAKQIRSEEAQRGAPRTPILALTANALAGEAVRVRECGMDDCLTKPIALQAFHKVLSHWLPHSGIQQSASHPSVCLIAGADEIQHIDVEVLRGLVGGDEEAVAELLREFEAMSRHIGEAIHAAIQAHSKERISQLAHQLKSASRSVGAMRLGHLCEVCESDCLRLAAFPYEPLQDLLRELRLVQAQLDNMIQEPIQ